MTDAMLFLLKIAITPLLVAAVSLAARWWGPTVGGILIGLPWFTGPALFVIVQDNGVDFGVGACIGIELGVVCISAFILAYGLAARISPWPVSLAAAVAAFGASAWTTQTPDIQMRLLDTGPPLWVAAGLALAGLCVPLLILPRSRAPPALQRLPWWDIPMRMAATGALVATLLLTADALGPQLSGIVATYPVIVTVVGTFTHHRWGRDAVWRMLRGLTASLFSFVMFFLVVGQLLPLAGLVLSYLCAAALAVTMTACLFFLNRRRAVR
jgi:hypothetical protein